MNWRPGKIAELPANAVVVSAVSDILSVAANVLLSAVPVMVPDPVNVLVTTSEVTTDLLVVESVVISADPVLTFVSPVLISVLSEELFVILVVLSVAVDVVTCVDSTAADVLSVATVVSPDVSVV